MSHLTGWRATAGKAERRMFSVVTWLIVLFVIAPIVFVPIISFTSVETLQFPPPAFSLRWYEEILQFITEPASDPSRFLASFGTSLAIATLSAVLCTLVGVPAALALVSPRLRLRPFIELVLALPIVFPTIALAIAMLLIVSQLPFDFGLWPIVVAHSVIALPFMIRNCVAALASRDPALLEAAAVLGAPAWRSFLEITLPLMKGGIVSGALLVFVISFNEFTITYFLYTVDVFPLSMWLFQRSNTSFSPLIFAVSTLIIGLNLALIILLDALVQRDA